MTQLSEKKIIGGILDSFSKYGIESIQVGDTNYRKNGKEVISVKKGTEKDAKHMMLKESKKAPTKHMALKESKKAMKPKYGK